MERLVCTVAGLFILAKDKTSWGLPLLFMQTRLQLNHATIENYI